MHDGTHGYAGVCRAGTHLCGFRPSLCLCVPMRILYVCARRCRERLPSACAFLRLCMFVPVSVFACMPILSMHTAPWVCVTPHPLGSTAHSCGEEGASPSFSRAREKTERPRQGLAAAYLVQDAQEGGRSWPGLPAACCTQPGSREMASSPHLLPASRDGRGRRQQVALPSRLRPPPGPLPREAFLSL